MTETFTDPLTPPPSPRPRVVVLQSRDIWQVLKAGASDFRKVPLFGLAFSSVYVVGGFLMLWLGAGHVTWTLATSLGFPLAAPFAAVGLYEVSRRLEAGEPLSWSGVLGVIWNERGRQVPWLGWIILIFFLFWTFLAHLIFALFMGLSEITNISNDLSMFLTPRWLQMLAAEFIVGAAMGALLFSLTVVSLPLLLDREVDFVTAMMTSVQVVMANPLPMLLWAVLIGVSMILALLPWFLGLTVVLPVFGHATWHLYRRALD